VISLHKQPATALAVAVFLCAPFLMTQDSDVQRYSEAGQKALASGNYAEAEQAYERLRELEPGIAEVHANLGLIYFEEGKFSQAIQPLQRAIKLKPSLTKSDALLAMSRSEVGRYQVALPGLEKCFRGALDPEMKRMCGLHLERAYTGVQQDRQAVFTALELDRLYPDDPEVLYHNGRIFGNFAFLSMQKLGQVAPNSVWKHQALAEAYESQGSYDAAISEYRQALAVDPHRLGIHYRIGRTLMARSQQTTSSSDMVDALNEFQDELQVNPSNANAAYEIAESFRNAGQLNEAQKFFDRALNYFPDFQEAQLGLGAVLTSLQKPVEALPHLQKAVKLNSQDEVAWYRLSQVQGMLGNTGEHVKAFAEFQRLHKEKSSRQEPGKSPASPDKVTPQRLDADSPQ